MNRTLSGWCEWEISVGAAQQKAPAPISAS
jgi:hypothetical protein